MFSHMLRVYNRFDSLERRRELRRYLTTAESVFWEAVRAKRFYGLKFRRQFGIGPYIADFYCPARRLVIEIDGDTHLDRAEIVYDQIRTEKINDHWIRVVRFRNEEVVYDLENVLTKLAKILHLPNPSSIEEGLGR